MGYAIQPLTFRAVLGEYEQQAKELLDAWKAGDPSAIEIARHKHPQFLSETVRWLPKNMSDSELRSAPFTHADAQLTIARWYDYENWPRLVEHVTAMRDERSSVSTFEAAVEAVVDGDTAALAALLSEHPDLVRERSQRVTHFDPPRHRATLLHYVAANGVEGYRQKTPANAVAVAKMLLEAGAQVDALFDAYGGQHATMSMLVSSCHPRRAGLHVALVDLLVDFGAAVEPHGSGTWTSPLLTALAFGYGDTAEALVRRGASVDSVAAAAGLGRIAEVRRRLTAATSEDRHRAMALAALHGHVEVLELLLDAGEDPNRYNPKGNHAHSTPLHQAALSGNQTIVRMLVERGARLDIKDTIYEATPLGWAVYGGHAPIAEYLRAHGAT